MDFAYLFVVVTALFAPAYLEEIQRRLRTRKSKRRYVPFNIKSPVSRPVGSTFYGRAYVIDGDSLVIGKTQIRLFGVDAPEINHPYGNKAKWAMVSLVKGQTIRVDVVATDAYGRTVARCLLQDGRDLSAEMVKLGLAIDWPKFSGGVYRLLEVPEARNKLWLADARQKGRMHVWAEFEARYSRVGMSN